jgi:hypothetical protein
MIPTFRPPSTMRRLYWAVTLAALGALLWWMKSSILPLYQVSQP